jgi:hypothetical protein
MESRPADMPDRIAAVVGILYLLAAVGYRVSARLLSPSRVLAPLFDSLPGALGGAVIYAAWTGLRTRRQGAWGLVLSGLAGAVLAALLRARIAGGMGGAVPGEVAVGFGGIGRQVYPLLCDLSAIVILFALFLAAVAPGIRPDAAQPPRSARRKAAPAAEDPDA